MLTTEKLKEHGANIEEGLQRCLNNEDFYLRLVERFLKEEDLSGLSRALCAGDYSDAFDKAHALKGVLGNLALTPLLEPVEELTELLRPGEPVEYTDLLSKIIEKKKELDALMD